jgi:hypothetical protein
MGEIAMVSTDRRMDGRKTHALAYLEKRLSLVSIRQR